MSLPPERAVLEAGVRELGIDASAAQIDALSRISQTVKDVFFIFRAPLNMFYGSKHVPKH